MTKVYAPVRDFTGPGAGGAVFRDGVAEVTNESLLTYFRDAGYGIGAPPPKPPAPGANLADARDYAQPIVIGTPLRDAAVDPHPDDFLAPTNAGEADPHGPLVVAPGLHAVPPAPIAPGPVSAETKAQDDRETAIAEAVLVDGHPATVIADPFGPVPPPEPPPVEPGPSTPAEKAGAAAKTSSPRRSKKA